MRALVALILLVILGAAAYAAETVTYSYDARGRLIRVSHAGSVNNNVVTNYTYDGADNRLTKATNNSSNPPGP